MTPTDTPQTVDPMAAVRQTLAEMRAVADGQREGYARMVELGGGIGLLGVREPVRYDAMIAWQDATENEHADTVLALLDVLDGVVELYEREVKQMRESVPPKTAKAIITAGLSRTHITFADLRAVLATLDEENADD